MKHYLEWVNSTWFGLFNQMKYCPVWDDKLNELLDNYSDTAKFKNSHVLLLGDNEIWISNRFYAYGCLRDEDTRPSVKTMFRLARLEDTLRGINEEFECLKYLDKISKIK